MKFRMTLIAASLSLIAGVSFAAGSAEFGVAPQETNSLVAKLAYKANLGQAHGFAVAMQHPGADGSTIHRLSHTFNNVRVWGSETVAVTDQAGNLVSEVNDDRRGALVANPGLSKSAFDFSVVPKLSAKEVIARTVNALAANGTHEYQPSAELVVFPLVKMVRTDAAKNKAEFELNAMDLQEEVQGHELAYVVQTRMKVGGKLQYRDSIVSANDGRVLKQWDALQSVAGSGKSQYTGTVAVETTLSGGVYKMIDSTRGAGGVFGGTAITNLNHADSGPGTVYSSSANSWGDGLNYNGGATTSVNGQTAAVDAMWGLRNTYDMLKNTLGWKSLDGKNTASYIGVHHNTSEDNAFYDPACKCMKIGDGGSMFKQLGSLDVIGHEMGHGVTAATSNLTYSGESGGLNEGSSDITGEMVEAYGKSGGAGSVIPSTGNDWVMGKEISKSGTPLRYMYKPSKDGRSPDAWSSSIGSLNVHYSSGPINRMFYFLAKGSNATSTSDYYSKYLVQAPKAMVGIGSDKAYRIWFRALTTKFTASTNYASAQAKCVQAATDLYGATSKEVIAVKRAFAAINVGADVTGG
jgi:Zn-dependent metalloprotease